MTIITTHSPMPWTYEYNPYTLQRGDAATEDSRPSKFWMLSKSRIFDTNEDTPPELQEANARLASSAPRLLAALVTCANLLADYDEHDGEEGEAYRDAVAVITAATTGKTD